MIEDVAALYVDPRGPYPKLVRHWYDETRDARLYAGPWPVVAHPPCGPYSKQRHNYRGTEHDCALRALEQVRTFGGVLEHPADSQLWPLLGLPKANGMVTDAFGGFAIQVAQVEWGHVARKRTWLYIVGVPFDDVARLYDARPHPGRAPTHWVSGGRNPLRRRPGDVVPPGIKVCSAQQRRRTPNAFAEWLIMLALASKVKHAATS